MNPPELRALANELVLQPLSLINGVANVDVHGANTNDWYIEYKQEMLEILGLEPDDITAAISRYALQTGTGYTTEPGGVRVPVMVSGPGIGPATWESMEVASINGRIISLGQLATIELREREPDSWYRINGKTAINLLIMATPDANQISVANNIYSTLSGISKQLPPGIHLTKSFDNTIQLRSDLRRNFLRTLFSVIILLVFVLIATRNFRYLLVVTVSLTANLAIAVLFFYFLKTEIHLYSLSGITLSLGLIIDNTLVMVDHLRHRRNMLVFTAILAATLTTVGALSSIFFLEESQRQNLADFAVVIIVNLGVSLFIGLLMIPSIMQMTGMLQMKKARHSASLRFRYRLSRAYSRFALRVNRFRAITLTIGLLAVGLPVFLFPAAIEKEGFWINMYNSTLGSSVYQKDIKPVVDKVLGGSLRLFYNSVWEKGFWDVPQRTQVMVRGSLAQGGTAEQSNALAALFEPHITMHPEVEQVIAHVFGNQFHLEISFLPEYEKGSFPHFIKARMERLAITQAGADFSIWGVGRGFSNATQAGYPSSRITLTGYSHKQLMVWARQFADTLLKMPRVDKVWIRGGETWWFPDEQRLFYAPNQEFLLAHGIYSEELAAELRRFSPQSDQLQWLSVNNKVSAIRLRPARESVPTAFEIHNAPLTLDNASTRMNQAGSFRQEVSGDQIHKHNQEYTISLAYSYLGPHQLAERVLKRQVNQINQVLPVGFKASRPEYGGWDREKKQQYWLIVLMVLIIYIITSILLESLRQPIAIILMVPLSFIGVFITYWMFDLSFDQGTYAAFLLLGGLVVNSAIFIINEQNNLRKRYPGASPISTYIRAVNAKIIPVLLTILSTILGLLPFVMFGQETFWFSLATGTIGGLLFSIPALLVFLPALLVMTKTPQPPGRGSRAVRKK
jgi:multidrug efflux pump subunit AcrB